MITELTPATYFDAVKAEPTLNVVMCYGQTCGPCKITMPNYEMVANHFYEHKKNDRVLFYRFHQWEKEYKAFIEQNGLGAAGVPTFRYYYMGDLVHEVAYSYTDPNLLKEHILDVIKVINSTMGNIDIDA